MKDVNTHSPSSSLLFNMLHFSNEWGNLTATTCDLGPFFEWDQGYQGLLRRKVLSTLFIVLKNLNKYIYNSNPLKPIIVIIKLKKNATI